LTCQVDTPVSGRHSLTEKPASGDYLGRRCRRQGCPPFPVCQRPHAGHKDGRQRTEDQPHQDQDQCCPACNGERGLKHLDSRPQLAKAGQARQEGAAQNRRKHTSQHDSGGNGQNEKDQRNGEIVNKPGPQPLPTAHESRPGCHVVQHDGSLGADTHRPRQQARGCGWNWRVTRSGRRMAIAL